MMGTGRLQRPQRLDGDALRLPILKILVRDPLPSPAAAFLAFGCDFLDLGGAGETMLRRNETTALSAVFFFWADAEAFCGAGERAPRKEPLLFFFLSPPKIFPIWSRTPGLAAFLLLAEAMAL